MFQYYEMSYGLNVEMHKQVSRFQINSFFIPSENVSSLLLFHSYVSLKYANWFQWYFANGLR